MESPAFRHLYDEVLDIIRITSVPRVADAHARFTTDQRRLNELIEQQFNSRGWQVHPDVTGDRVTRLKADYLKDRVQVEVQFGNIARAIYDVFKFQISYSLNKIDLGILAIPMQDFARTIDSNVAYYERIVRELPYAKLSVTLPILVVGMYP